MDLTNIYRGVNALTMALNTVFVVVLNVVLYNVVKVSPIDIIFSTMNSHIPPQASFFYSGKWIQKMDFVLLTTLIEKRIGHGWDDASIPKYLVRFCLKLINRRFGSEITCSDIMTRLKILKQRYDTFKALVDTTGVRWDYVEKIVVANDAVWNGVLQRNAFAGAYYHRDEPHYNELATMFGYFDVKVEEPTEVITLSDNTEIVVITDTIEPKEPIRGNATASSVDVDEVNSPPLGSVSRIRRKLFHFDEVNHDQDHLSSSKAPSRVFPAKKVAVSSPKGSSCASWSPLPSSHKTAP